MPLPPRSVRDCSRIGHAQRERVCQRTSPNGRALRGPGLRAEGCRPSNRLNHPGFLESLVCLRALTRLHQPHPLSHALTTLLIVHVPTHQVTHKPMSETWRADPALLAADAEQLSGTACRAGAEPTWGRTLPVATPSAAAATTAELGDPHTGSRLGMLRTALSEATVERVILYHCHLQVQIDQEATTKGRSPKWT